MTISGLIPMIRVGNVAATVLFYREVLGFNCTAFNKEYNWATVTCGNAMLMICGFPEGVNEQSSFTGSFYFRVDSGIDTWWAGLKDKAEVCYGIEDFEYGMREFAIFDNNGYLLQFGQEIKLV